MPLLLAVVTAYAEEVPVRSPDQGSVRLAEGDATFRIMSYNVKHGLGMDKRLDVRRMCEVVKQANPAYVGLQEIDQMTSRVSGTNTCRIVGEACGMHATFAAAMPHRGGEYGNVLLSKEKPLSVKKYPLPRPKPKREPRVLVMCEFADRWVGTMHLNGEKTAENTVVPLIRRAVEECAATKPVFVTGDWNTQPGSDMLKRMQEFLTILSKTNATTVVRGNHCIDYVAVDKAHAKDFVVADAQVVPELVVSDHRPIYVDIKSRSK